MEAQPHIPHPKQNKEELPDQIEQVAGKIHKALQNEYFYDFTAEKISGHSVIFYIDDESPMTVGTFSIIANDCSAYSVNIQFNEEEQTILVSPMEN